MNSDTVRRLSLWPCPLHAGDGYIITIASIEALSPYPSAPAYSASKWGLRGWNKAVYAGASHVSPCRCHVVHRSPKLLFDGSHVAGGAVKHCCRAALATGLVQCLHPSVSLDAVRYEQQH